MKEQRLVRKSDKQLSVSRMVTRKACWMEFEKADMLEDSLVRWCLLHSLDMVLEYNLEIQSVLHLDTL